MNSSNLNTGIVHFLSILSQKCCQILRSRKRTAHLQTIKTYGLAVVIKNNEFLKTVLSDF